MNWLAVLLSLASLGGNPAPADVKPRKCAAAKSTAAKSTPAKKCKKPKKQPSARVTPRQKKPAADAPRADGESPRTQANPNAPAGPDATPTPQPTVTPQPTATPVATVTPAPPGTHPTGTNVDLTDIRVWSVRASFRTLAAGPIDFNVNNRGEDDHNLSVRDSAKEYGRLDLAPLETGTLTLNLWIGNYTLYCSLPGHEEAGMHTTISVR